MFIYRNAWKGLRNAVVTCAICILFLRDLDLISPLPTRSASDRHPYTFFVWWPLPPFACRSSLCRCSSRKSNIPKLSYTQAGFRWRSSWRRICICLVWIHDISEKSRMDRMGTGNIDCEDASCKRSRGTGGFGRFRLGTMGREEAEAKLPKPGQEEQVSNDALNRHCVHRCLCTKMHNQPYK